jgi:hypothetical protein
MRVNRSDDQLTHLRKVMTNISSPINFASFVLALGLGLWCSTSGWSQGAAANDIHRIDFRNFTYYPLCLNGYEVEKVPIKVTKGHYKHKDSESGEVTLDVRDIAYGDLNGDGRDEAIVVTSCNTGGFGWFSEGYVYVIRGGKPAMVSRIEGSDRAAGGIRAVRVVGRLLKVERLGSRLGQAIGAEHIDTTTYQLKGGELVQVGEPVRRSLRGEALARSIQFERGKTSAVINGTTSGAQFYMLSARRFQTLSVRITSTLDNARFELMEGDYTMAYRATQWSGKLEAAGEFYIVVIPTKGKADYRLEVTVR